MHRIEHNSRSKQIMSSAQTNREGVRICNSVVNKQCDDIGPQSVFNYENGVALVEQTICSFTCQS